MAIRLTLAAGSLSMAAAAFAQDSTSAKPDSTSAKNLEAITVTGSRIRRVEAETAQPLYTMTQADIQKTGLVNIGDILQNLAVSGSPGFSKANVLSSNPEQGGQYINMRNLGENRVLVLVNGKRWATSLDGYTDMSTIPSSLVERIEILKDGASAIYGSDAIAGVVNIILKDHYQGAEASGYVGENDHGDGTQQAYSFTLGSRMDKTSIMFNASYTKEDAIWGKDREITHYTYGPNHSLDGLSGTGVWGRFQTVDPKTGAGAGKTYRLNHSGGYDGDGVGADARNLGNYRNTLDYPNDYYNSVDQMNWSPSNELKSLFTSMSHDFNDYVTFKSTASYSERESDRQVAGYPLNSRSQPTFPVYISGQSYYNPMPGKDLYFYRRTVEQPRGTFNDVRTYHWDADVEGGFELGSHHWNWDAGFNYNKQDSNIVTTGNLNLVTLKQALGPSFLNGSGVVQCGTPASPIALTQCVPFNILGGPTASTPAMIDYVMTRGTEVLQNVSKEYSANLTGGLFNLPAGEVSMAAGYEHQALSGYDHPDVLSSTGYSTNLAGRGTDARYNVDSFYLELMVPILKDLPGARELTADVASRYSDYSVFGGAVKNKYSLSWRPINDLLVRANYAQGFRAPTLGDTFGGGSQSFDYYTDSCDSSLGPAATKPSVANACRAAGAPANFHQTDVNGRNVSGRESQGTTPFYTGVANASLMPETSISRTAGFVYSPSWLTGLDVTMDWYDIRIVNDISPIKSTYVLDQCYVYGVSQFCNDFSRDPSSHQVIGLNRGNLNLGMLRTSGYDYDVKYRLPKFDWGQLTIDLNGTYLTSYNTRSTDDADIHTYAGQYGYPRNKANVGIDWSNGNWGATWSMRYYGALRDTCQYTDECNQPDYQGPSWDSGIGANRKGASTYHDVQARYSFPWKGVLSVGVKNLFAKQPTIIYSVDNSNTAHLDPTLDIDRYFYLQYSQKF